MLKPATQLPGARFDVVARLLGSFNVIMLWELPSGSAGLWQAAQSALQVIYLAGQSLAKTLGQGP